MDSNHNDISLFGRIAAGDEEAFETIFHAHNRTLYPFILSVVKNEADAKEIIQEVFLKLWLKRESLTTIDNPGGWLYTVAANTAYAYLRREARYATRLQTAAGFPGASLDDIHEQFDTKEMKAMIAEAVVKLPARRRQVFEMSRYEGRSRREIAEELGISENTVRNHLAEAVSSIQDYIKKHGSVYLPAILILADFYC
jgi:RNA polymerase sigma-70 factor (family 1)